MRTILENQLNSEFVEALNGVGQEALFIELHGKKFVVLKAEAYDSAMRNISGAELTMKEIESRYADQWVLIKVTALDEYGNPAKGVVVTHSDERDALTAPVMQMHGEDTRAKSYIFFTGNVMPENMTVLL